MKTRRQAVVLLSGITLAVALSLAPAATLWADPVTAAAPPPPSMAAAQSAYGHLPLSFEANQGQTDSQVNYLTRRRGYQLFLTPSEAVLALRTGKAKGEGREGETYQGKLSNSASTTSDTLVRIKFDGANPHAEVVGLDKLPGIVNYFIGSDPSKWRTNIPTYKKVEYKNVYPGIDLVYYGNQGQLEYDLIVAPGADPNLIRLVFDGAEKVEVDPASGDLVLTLSEPSANSELSTEDSARAAGATLRLHKPVVYQMGEHGDKHLLAGTYVLLASETSPPGPASAVRHPSETPSPSSLTPHVAFQVAFYDASKPLIIDPVLSWATYLGGSGLDQPYGIAVDTAGNAYVTGYTTTPGSGFPGTAGSLLQSTYGGNTNAFVTKLNAAGTALVYSTYLGGSDGTIGHGIAVDGAGNAYVTGYTGSGLPGTAGSSIQSTFGGGSSDAFVAKISFTPTANAGPDQSVPEGTLVTLDGTGSSGGSLTYTWTQVPGLPTAVLSGATTAHPTFSAPHVPAAGGTVTFKLVVCEGTSSNCSDPDTVNVHITNVNHPPVADAGPDQTVQEGSPVQLDGTASYDIDVEPLTYQWTQILGPAVTVVGGNTALPTFVAPTVGPAGATIVFDLTVTDPHTLTGSDSVSIHVTNVNHIPVANAGPDQTVNENTLVTLNGAGSTDPDLDALSYSWTQIAGPSVALTGGTTANPTFTAPSVGAGGTTLTFRLVVSDGQVSSVADTVNIRILDIIDPPVCTLGQPSVASLWPPNHTMVPVTIMGVTDPNNQAITITYTAVTQDEPVNGLGDGDTSPDAAVSGNQILLRAERSGTGNGRVYAVHFTATDDQGASCSGTVKVSVPHSKQDPAGEGPQAFNSFTP